MKMYKAYFYNSGELNEVEVEKRTEKSVWIRGNRRAIECEYESYHDDFESAKAWLLDKAEKQVSRARLALASANGKLGNIKGMKP